MDKKPIYGMSIIAMGASVAILASVGIQAGIGEAVIAEDSGSYAYNLSSGKNALTQEAVTSGTATISSETGGSIELSLSDVSVSSGWGSISAGGYIANSDILHGLLGFTVEFTGSLSVYWSDVKIDPSDLEGTSSADLTSGTGHSFVEDYPNYFLLKNTGSDASDISSISFTYDCVLHPIEFGSYPQTVVSDTTLISTLDGLTPDSEGYVTNDGTKYLKTAGTGKNGYTSGSTYYFEVEPIVWDVFEDGTIIAQKILASSAYFTSDSGTRDVSGATVYPNNYRYSTARAFLNGLNGTDYSVADFSGTGNSFLSKAFTTAEQNKIATTEVDNSAATTNSDTNAFACENTNDKVYLLSYEDMNSGRYFSTDAERSKLYTDYAHSQGPEMSSKSNKKAWWRLRSPDANNSAGDAVYVISTDGSRMGGDGSLTINIGLLPAMKLA